MTFHLWIYSLNFCNNQGWAESKPGARTSKQIFLWKAGNRLRIPHSLCSGTYQRKLELEVVSELGPRHHMCQPGSELLYQVSVSQTEFIHPIKFEFPARCYSYCEKISGINFSWHVFWHMCECGTLSKFPEMRFLHIVWP